RCGANESKSASLQILRKGDRLGGDGGNIGKRAGLFCSRSGGM
ncbi:MAG: hypothetical protein RL472_2206, partial [Pseudomonadota bacterium]